MNQDTPTTKHSARGNFVAYPTQKAMSYGAGTSKRGDTTGIGKPIDADGTRQDVPPSAPGPVRR